MSEPTPPESAGVLCITDPVLRKDGRPHEAQRGRICDLCHTRLTVLLSEIPAAYALVSAEPVKGVSEVRTRAFESRPPLNLDALSLTGPGWETPLSILDFWVTDIAEHMGEPQPQAHVNVFCTWLIARLDWIAHNYVPVDELAEDLRKMAAPLRRYAGTEGGESVGQCPRTFGENVCGTELRVDPYATVIQCPRCHQQWSQHQGGWLRLAAQQERAGVRTGPKKPAVEHRSEANA